MNVKPALVAASLLFAVSASADSHDKAPPSHAGAHEEVKQGEKNEHEMSDSNPGMATAKGTSMESQDDYAHDKALADKDKKGMKMRTGDHDKVRPENTPGH